MARHMLIGGSFFKFNLYSAALFTCSTWGYLYASLMY